MQRRLRLSWLPALMGVAITAFSGCAFKAELPSSAVRGDVELLRQVAEGWRANRAKIKTWQGTANVVNVLSHVPGDERAENSVVSFAYDGNLEAKRSNWERLEVRSTFPEDQDAAAFTHILRNCMVKDDAFFQFGPIYPGTSVDPHAVLIYSPEQKNITRHGYNFDPFHSFSHSDSDIGDIFLDHYRQRDALPGSPESVAAARRTVKRQGTLVSLELVSRDGTSEYVVDTSQGYNLVSYRGTFEDGRYEETLKIDYQQVDGVFVPARATSDVDHVRPNVGLTHSHKEVEFTENTVNQPVPPEEFDLAALGLRDGDRVMDTRDGTFYEFSAVPPVNDP
jgi:hypothetical protein